MANTYTCLYYHVVFSTKNRIDYIRQEIESDVWEYIGGIVRDNKMKAIQIGGVDNHVHALIAIPTTMKVSEAMQHIKGGSSRWISEHFSDIRYFSWQDGYGAFTVSKSNLQSVIDYIRNQREHHKTRSFDDEYIELLKKHDIQYDARYLLG